jgi:hypothetical protein
MGDNILRVLHFADDQMLIAKDKGDLHYVVREVQAPYGQEV